MSKKRTRVEMALLSIDKRNRRREKAIDDSMERASEMNEVLQSREDPYAFHKAVESLPDSVLINILESRQTWKEGEA